MPTLIATIASAQVMYSLVKTLTSDAVMITNPSRLVRQPLVTLLSRVFRNFNFFWFNGEQPIVGYKGLHDLDPALKPSYDDVVLG